MLEMQQGQAPHHGTIRMTDAEREPAAWEPGDRSYCIRGSRKTRPTLEVGKVYTVQNAIPVRGSSEAGLTLSGVSLPDGFRGISSYRFKKMSERAHLKEDRP